MGAVGTSVAGAHDVTITSAYTELPIHVVSAPCTTPAESASTVVYTSSMRMTAVTLTCFDRTPWGRVPMSTV